MTNPVAHMTNPVARMTNPVARMTNPVARRAWWKGTVLTLFLTFTFYSIYFFD